MRPNHIEAMCRDGVWEFCNESDEDGRVLVLGDDYPLPLRVLLHPRERKTPDRKVFTNKRILCMDWTPKKSDYLRELKIMYAAEDAMTASYRLATALADEMDREA